MKKFRYWDVNRICFWVIWNKYKKFYEKCNKENGIKIVYKFEDFDIFMGNKMNDFFEEY